MGLVGFGAEILGWVVFKKATSNSGRNKSEAMFDKITNRVLFCNDDCEACFCDCAVCYSYA